MLSIVAAEAAEHSKTLFYLLGGLLAGWAVALAAFGIVRAQFPATDTASRGVMAISAVLVVAAATAAVVTA